MKKLFKHMMLIAAVTSTALTTPGAALAADTAEASLNVSGNVPEYFSITTRGIPGDLDLTPRVQVNDRRLAIVHFKYNKDIANLNVSSDTNSGQPEQGGTAYDFDGDFELKFGACSAVDAAVGGINFTISNVATDVADTTVLTEGVEEDCDLMASWKGTTTGLPLAGKYSMTINLQFVSQ